MLSGHVSDSFRRALHPVNIAIHDSDTGLPFTGHGDTTDATGNFAVTLPDGRYGQAVTARRLSVLGGESSTPRQ